MIRAQYQSFKSKLQSMIQNSQSLDIIGQMIFEDPYCNVLSSMIANKYNVDAQDILSQAFLDLINHKILVPVITQQQEFSGRIFKLTLTDIAVRLQGKSFEELNEDVAALVDNNAIADDSNYDNQLLKQRYGHVLQNKLQELIDYKNRLLLTNHKVDINLFAEITQLHAENVLQKFGASRQNINKFKPQLAELLEEYLKLYKYWYNHQEIFIKKLIATYGNYKAIYQELAPEVTYKTFIGIMEYPTVWDLQNLYNKFGDEI